MAEENILFGERNVCHFWIELRPCICISLLDRHKPSARSGQKTWDPKENVFLAVSTLVCGFRKQSTHTANRDFVSRNKHNLFCGFAKQTQSVLRNLSRNRKTTVSYFPETANNRRNSQKNVLISRFEFLTVCASLHLNLSFNIRSRYYVLEKNRRQSCL